MKMIFKLLPLVVGLATAQADLIVEQKMESPFMNGNMTMKIKGDKARIDMPDSPTGAASVIIDGASGEMNMVMHSQKMVMKMNLNDAKKAAEAQGAKVDTTAKPKPTGKKEKVGEFDTEIYELDMGEAGKAQIWVAAKYPDADEIKKQLAKLSQSLPQAKGQLDPNSLDVPGMVVKSETMTPAGKVTTLLGKVTKQDVPDSDLVVPKDYQSMDFPALGK